MNSGFLDGLGVEDAKRAIAAWLSERGLGEATVGYRLRDWLISRQRYWGAPIPVVHCEGCGVVPVPDDQLPVLLPEVDDYAPKGMSPIAANTAFVETTCPACGGPARRETDTMDTFVDSSWYFLRYTAPHLSTGAVRARRRRLLAARSTSTSAASSTRSCTCCTPASSPRCCTTWGTSGFAEPFARLFTQGMIYYQGAKMSKSKGNVVAPDEMIDRFGADTLRLYVLFMGPAADDAEWSTTASRGSGGSSTGSGGWPPGRRSAALVERPSLAAVRDDPPRWRSCARPRRRSRRSASDIGERFSFHTAISAIQELVNDATKARAEGALSGDAGAHALRYATQTVVSLLFVFAPHLASELWEALGGERLWVAPWPEADEAFLERESVTVVVQVNGKLRDRLDVPAGLAEDELAAGRARCPRCRRRSTARPSDARSSWPTAS